MGKSGLLLLSLSAVPALTGCPASSDAGISPAGAQQSTNWAGYVKTGLPGAYNAASGTWTVPGIICGANDSDSSSWTGVGGGTTADPTLVQAGTSQTCTSGQANYSAWWEVIPAPAVNPGGILDTNTYTVHAGDVIHVDVDGSSGSVWDITIHNQTRGWTFNTTTAYSSAGETAEWIEESPLAAGTSGAGQQALADFGRVTFGGATANGAAADLQLSDRVVMTDGNGKVIANTSAPSGDGFAVCYGSDNC